MKFLKSKILIGAVIVLTLAIVTAIGIYRSYHDPVVREITLEKKLDGKPFRFVFLADLHELEVGNENEDLYEKVRELDPDFILMGGDILNWNSEEDTYAVETVKNLSEIADVYFALGNHEIEYMNFRGEIRVTGNDRDFCAFFLPDPVKKSFVDSITKAGAVVLQKEYRDIEVQGNKVRIGAAYETMTGLNEKDLEHTMPQGMYRFLTDYQDTDSMKIYISHRPFAFLTQNASELWDIDVLLSGHEHGGQVVVPLAGGLFSRERGFFPRYVHGAYELGDTDFIVSAGLSSQPGTFPRFNNPPEIVVVDVN